MPLGHISMVILLTVALADVPVITPLRKPARPMPDFSKSDTVPLFPEVVKTEEQNPEPAQVQPDSRPRAERMQERSRLEIQRFVSGEFARAVKPLPSEKKGFRYAAEKPLDEESLRRALSVGSAANPGDQVQITKIEFKDKEILVHINGGSKKKRSWRERVQVSVGGMPSASTSGNSPGYQAVGSTLILEYGRALPDFGPDEFKTQLGPFLDFSKQRSAAVHWIETLPKEFQEAIKDKRAMVGMDREMVQAAMGKPDKKVRERDIDGVETEDWIYGHPPAKTVFVKFTGEKVTSVKQYPT